MWVTVCLFDKKGSINSDCFIVFPGHNTGDNKVCMAHTMLCASQLSRLAYDNRYKSLFIIKFHDEN